MKRHCSLLVDFKNGYKNVKTFLKGEQIQLLYRKVYKKITIIGRKLIISNSNKMQSLLNATKALQTVPWKSESHLKIIQKQIKSSNRS